VVYFLLVQYRASSDSIDLFPSGRTRVEVSIREQPAVRVETAHWADVGFRVSHQRLGNGRFEMRITRAYRVLLIAMGTGAAIVLAVGMADAAKGGRDAAMEKCIAQAQSEAPGDTVGSGIQTRRTAIYKSCMTQAGHRP
jgi:hypothetical protein